MFYIARDSSKGSGSGKDGKRKSKALGWAKKNWYPVISPSAFGEKEIASVAAVKPETLVGRKLSVTLSDLTGNFRDYRTKIKLKIVGMEGGKARTAYAGQEMVREQVARLVRRWSSRIDNVEPVILADKSSVVVKTLTVSRRRVNTSVKKDLRALISQKIHEQAAKTNLDDFVKEVNTGVFSKAVYSGLSKVYPVRAVEVRMVARK
ncbi:MAG: hypothetical protein KAJ91_02195 [Candidatus Aenigmarchaeota archaeon]|nr:hypothetical protein [Candidatus Aenigmarchaeota archaeon]